jgi:hypothetical protein
MTDGKCDNCSREFQEGQEILVYQYDFGVLHFCDNICAGDWFTQNECEWAMYYENGD